MLFLLINTIYQMIEGPRFSGSHVGCRLFSNYNNIIQEVTGMQSLGVP